MPNSLLRVSEDPLKCLVRDWRGPGVGDAIALALGLPVPGSCLAVALAPRRVGLGLKPRPLSPLILCLLKSGPSFHNLITIESLLLCNIRLLS